MSGYSITIKVFVEADPRHPTSITDAMLSLQACEDAVRDAVRMFDTVEVSKPRWIARRKRDVDSITGTADDQRICRLIPAPHVPAAQEGAGADKVSPTQVRSGSSPDEFPDIPENLRRVTPQEDDPDDDADGADAIAGVWADK
jgi:hypothetical protein